MKAKKIDQDRRDSMSKRHNSQQKNPGQLSMSRGSKPQNLWGTVKRIIGEVLQFKGLAILVLIATLLSTVVTVLGPRELGKATTLIFEGVRSQVTGGSGIQFDAIARVLIWVLILYIVSAVFGAIQGYAMTTITETVAYRLRQRMIDKINRMPMAFFESQPIGEMLSRIVNDVDLLGMSLSQTAGQFLSAVATMIGIATIMFTINATLAWIVMVIVPVSSVMMRILLKYSQRYFRGQQRTLGVLSGHVEETYSGQRIVKAFNQESNMIDRFESYNEKLRHDSQRAQFISGIMFPLMRFLSSLGYVAVVIVGAYLAIMGRIGVGSIQAFTQYVNRFSQPITQISQIVNIVQQMAAAGERVYEFLDAPEESQTQGDILDVSQVDGYVQFNHVQFGYTENQIIIQDFSATVKPGQKVALVGPTGAGKSTMVKLLMRFYDVDKGHIFLDSNETMKYSRTSYQQAMAMVLQDTWLFSGTIMENIRYGRLDATDEEVIAAAKAARVDHYIKSLPGGYDFKLNETVDNISQGQKQLITIARAMLADRPVLILDEATSSVDTRTEVLIQEAMDELMMGRTSFIIAHRLSTIKDADLILYMENGDIVEQGNHQELMAQSGRYMTLYNSQFAIE